MKWIGALAGLLVLLYGVFGLLSGTVYGWRDSVYTGADALIVGGRYLAFGGLLVLWSLSYDSVVSRGWQVARIGVSIVALGYVFWSYRALI